VEPVLLLSLRRGPAHGYSLLAELEEYDLGQFDPSVVYRLLRDMESAGWVGSTWDEQATQGPPRRVYELTTTGKEILAEWAQELERSQARIEKFLAEYGKRG
jgi:PadR family transcriptional regulator PadR